VDDRAARIVQLVAVIARYSPESLDDLERLITSAPPRSRT
jgi:hypothetical protein